MDVNQAIAFGLIEAEAYTIPPSDLTNSAGKTFVAAGRTWQVVTTIYANDLATDMNPVRGTDIVSIGLIAQATDSGDVAVAIRGTEGILEWVHDIEFGLVPCPILPGSGSTEDGFTAMYLSLRIDADPNSMPAVKALATLKFPRPVSSMIICGHSLGGALATLLALDVAANTTLPRPTVYTYASPRVGDPNFVSTFDQLVKDCTRIANRLDIVPKLPLPPLYEHVRETFDLNPFHPLPPRFLVKFTIPCEHALNTYLHLLSLLPGQSPLPLDATCTP